MDLQSFTRSLSSLFFPDYCFLCKEPLSSREHILCRECIQRIEPVPLPRCPRCGLARYKIHCPRCRKLKPVFSSSYQLFIFDGAVRELIHLWKYQEQVKLTEFFSRLLVELTPPLFFKDADLLAWVPHNTLIFKGYNQSRLLSSKVGSLLKIPVCPAELLHKKVKTLSQTQFHTFQERRNNIEGCFTADNPLFFEGRKIIIIDDVMTTGHTLNELARAIQPFQPHSIKVLTIAQAHCPL